MESCVMSDHQLKFKGPGFDFDAKGWMAILAAIVIVALVAVPWFWHREIGNYRVSLMGCSPQSSTVTVSP
jgi:hypothetical protein